MASQGAYTYILSKRLKQKGNIKGLKLKDIAFASMLIAEGIVAYFILKAIGAHIIYAGIVAGSLGLIGVALVIPLRYEENTLIRIGRKRKFKDEQQYFPYRRGTAHW